MLLNILVFIVLVSSFANTQADSVNICTDIAEFAPYTYHPRTDNKIDKSKLTGATKEFLDEIFKTINMGYKLDLLPWKRCLSEVENFGTNNNYEVFSE